MSLLNWGGVTMKPRRRRAAADPALTIIAQVSALRVHLSNGDLDGIETALDRITKSAESLVSRPSDDHAMLANLLYGTRY